MCGRVYLEAYLVKRGAGASFCATLKRKLAPTEPVDIFMSGLSFENLY